MSLGNASFEGMRILLLPAVFLSVAAAEPDEFDPLSVDIGQALDCTIDARTYNGFALQLHDPAVGWKKRGWKPVKSVNPYLAEYAIPKPIAIAGYRTNRIAFSAGAILAVLDEPDPAKVGAALGVANQAAGAAETLGLPADLAAAVPRAGKFLGEKVVLDHKERDENLGTTFHTRIARSVSTVTSHPGKTLAGCAYSISTEDD